jgi:hypothetical protein
MESDERSPSRTVMIPAAVAPPVITGLSNSPVATLQPQLRGAAAPGSTAPQSCSGIAEKLEAFNAQLPSPISRHTIAYFLAGAMARMTSATLTSPLDTVKVRVQFSQRAAGVKQFSGALEAAKHMWKYEGLIAFDRGLPARLVYIAPAAAISFVFYEEFRSLYHQVLQDKALERQQKRSGWIVAVPLILGGVARVIGTTLRTPFDVIKQRMQIQGSLPGFSNNNSVATTGPRQKKAYGLFKNSGEAAVGVFRVEGAKALWSGLGATILRDIPFASKNMLHRWMNPRERERERERDSVDDSL